MENENTEKERKPSKKGCIAVIVLAIALYGIYSLILSLLEYLNTI